MKLRRSLSQPDEPIELNLIPLIDIIMFLLIFFVSTTSFMEEKGVQVDKPASGGASQSDQQSIVFAVASDGRITFEAGRWVWMGCALRCVACARRSRCRW